MFGAESPVFLTEQSYANREPTLLTAPIELDRDDGPTPGMGSDHPEGHQRWMLRDLNCDPMVLGSSPLGPRHARHALVGSQCPVFGLWRVNG